MAIPNFSMSEVTVKRTDRLKVYVKIKITLDGPLATNDDINIIVTSKIGSGNAVSFGTANIKYPNQVGFLEGTLSVTSTNSFPIFFIGTREGLADNKHLEVTAPAFIPDHNPTVNSITLSDAGTGSPSTNIETPYTIKVSASVTGPYDPDHGLAINLSYTGADGTTGYPVASSFGYSSYIPEGTTLTLTKTIDGFLRSAEDTQVVRLGVETGGKTAYYNFPVQHIVNPLFNDIYYSDFSILRTSETTAQLAFKTTSKFTGPLAAGEGFEININILVPGVGESNHTRYVTTESAIASGVTKGDNVNWHYINFVVNSQEKDITCNISSAAENYTENVYLNAYVHVPVVGYIYSLDSPTISLSRTGETSGVCSFGISAVFAGQISTTESRTVYLEYSFNNVNWYTLGSVGVSPNGFIEEYTFGSGSESGSFNIFSLTSAATTLYFRTTHSDIISGTTSSSIAAYIPPVGYIYSLDSPTISLSRTGETSGVCSFGISAVFAGQISTTESRTVYLEYSSNNVNWYTLGSVEVSPNGFIPENASGSGSKSGSFNIFSLTSAATTLYFRTTASGIVSNTTSSFISAYIPPILPWAWIPEINAGSPMITAENWNLFIEKIKDVLAAKGESTTARTNILDGAKGTQGLYFKASMFNAVKNTINILAATGIPNKSAGQQVLASDFNTLKEKINSVINNL